MTSLWRAAFAYVWLRARRTAMCVPAAVFVLAVCAPCRAQPAIHWEAPAACPQADAFQTALDERFNHTAALRDVERIDATLTRVSRTEFQLTLSVRRELTRTPAQRRLSARSCGELLAPAVWFVGLAAGPVSMQQAELTQLAPSDAIREFVPDSSSGSGEVRGDTHDEREPAHARSAASASAPTLRGERSQALAQEDGARFANQYATRRDLAEPAEPAERRRPPWHVRVAGLAGVVGGAGTPAQGMVGAATSVSVGVSHTQLSVSELLPAERTVPHAGHVQVWSLEARLSECALWGRRLQAGPCAGIALLRTTAHTRDFGHDVHRVLVWGLAELGVRFAYPVTSSMELSLAGAIGTPLTPRPSFTVESVGAVATAARWSQAAQLGLIYVVR